MDWQAWNESRSSSSAQVIERTNHGGKDIDSDHGTRHRQSLGLACPDHARYSTPATVSPCEIKNCTVPNDGNGSHKFGVCNSIEDPANTQ